MSAATTEAERFDTLITPSGTVATLNQIAKKNNIEAMGFDGAFPDSKSVQTAIGEEIEQTLSADKKPVLLFSLLVYNAEESLRLIDDLKKDFGKRIVTIVGGQLVPFAQTAYQSNPAIDVSCVGDGEALIPQLNRDIERNRLQKNYSAWLAESLDLSKRGKFEFTSYDNFFQIEKRLKAQKEISGFTQLCIQGPGGPGCSWAANNKKGACDFCALQNIEEMNKRTLEELMLAEKSLEDKFSPERIFDVANQFLPHLERRKNIAWLKRFSAERKKFGLKAKKYIYLTVGSVDEEIAVLLAEIGVEEVYLGVDHFYPETLKETNKSHRSVARLQKTLDALVKNGIKFRIGIVLGSGAESRESLAAVREGVDWLKKNYRGNLKALGVFPIYVLPGSGVFERAKQLPEARPIIESFESKGYFTEEEENSLSREYIREHSKLSFEEIWETAKSIQKVLAGDMIAYDYRKSPDAACLKEKSQL